MIISSYRNARVIRSRKIFSQIVQVAKETSVIPARKKLQQSNYDSQNSAISFMTNKLVPTFDGKLVLYEVTFANDFDLL